MAVTPEEITQEMHEELNSMGMGNPEEDKDLDATGVGGDED